MFLKTYGRQYQENSVVFTDLFDDLERYYRGNRGNVDLQASLNRFFIKLYQKMFNLLNGQYSLDYNFLQCLAKHMEKTRPFDDAAEKLTQQIKRSFLEARTFVQALAIGRDTARTASEVWKIVYVRRPTTGSGVRPNQLQYEYEQNSRPHGRTNF